MERDQLPQAVPRDPGLRGNIVEAAVQSIQVATDVRDHVEQQAVPLACLQRQPPAD